MQGAALLPVLFFIALGLGIDKEPLPLFFLAAVFQAIPMVLLGTALRSAAKVKVTVDPTNLVLIWITERGKRTEQVIPMESIEAAYVLEPNTQGTARRLRIARRDGDVFLGAQNVPAASAEWLANQISRVAREAKERAAGEPAPEMLDLLDQSTRAEAERKLRLQRQTRRT